MKIGATFFAFENLTAKYILILEEAKKQCDYLIVGLNTSIHTPNLINRFIQLQGCKYVDEIIPYETAEDIEYIIKSFKVNIHIVEEKYKFQPFTSKLYCLRNNISIHYSKKYYIS